MMTVLGTTSGKALPCTVSSWAGDKLVCAIFADYSVWCFSKFCYLLASPGATSDGSTESDLISAEYDVTVSDRISADIMVDIASVVGVGPCGYEEANDAAKHFTPLQSLHRCSSSIIAVVAEGAEFAYFESFHV